MAGAPAAGHEQRAAPAAGEGEETLCASRGVTLWNRPPSAAGSPALERSKASGASAGQGWARLTWSPQSRAGPTGFASFPPALPFQHSGYTSSRGHREFQRESFQGAVRALRLWSMPPSRPPTEALTELLARARKGQESFTSPFSMLDNAALPQPDPRHTRAEA